MRFIIFLDQEEELIIKKQFHDSINQLLTKKNSKENFCEEFIIKLDEEIEDKITIERIKDSKNKIIKHT
jgi:hypothetical protein